MAQPPDIWTTLDPVNDGNASVFLSEALNNRKDAHQAWTKSNYLFIITAAAFILLKWGKTSEFSIFGIKITDVQTILLVAPSVLSFIVYQNVCYFVLGERLRELIESYMRNRLPSVYENNLEYIIDSPNFFNIERFLARGNRPGAQLSGYFGIFVALLFLFVPIFFVVGLLYVSFRDAMSTNDYPIWSWVFVVIPAIIATRALTMVIYLLIDEIR